MTVIRAFTIHFPKSREKSTFNFLELNFSRYCPPLLDVKGKLKLNVFTNRVVLPPILEFKNILGENSLSHLSRQLEDFLDDYGVDIAAIPIEGAYSYLKNVSEALRETEKIYFSFNVGGLSDYPSRIDLRSVVKTLREIGRVAGQDAFTRIAFTYGKTPVTPYFPATTSRKPGLSLSLLYASQLKNVVEKGGDLRDEMRRILVNFSKLGVNVSKDLDLMFLGVDASISPWMENSVANLIEAMISDRFGSPGTYHAIFNLNSLIEQVSNGLKTTGFNEVMLPLAEDNWLKNAVREGRLKIEDFVSYISVCVAGLDMTPIPSNVSDDKLIKVVRDVVSISHVKKRTVGVRLILVNANSGEEVKLEKFGKTPVLSI